MNPILGQLLALTAALKAAAGATLEELAELRRFIAAILIQQNPGNPIPADPAIDPAIATALEQGAALAATLSADGIRARFSQDNELAPTAHPERPTHVFGPFVDPWGNLVRFLIFENARFHAVHVRLPNGKPSPETILLFPQPVAPRDGNRAFDIPAGTVWIRARLLVAGAAGCVGLRVARGSFSVSRPATVANNGKILVFSNAQWTLSVEPEQPPAGEASGSDANGATITLPQSLEVRSSGAAVVTGAIGISGFGSALDFDNPKGAPIMNGASIDFPFDPPNLAWTIAGNRSAAVQLTGDCQATSAVWSLPVNAEPPNAFSEAPHGGAIIVRLQGSIALQLAGMTGGDFHKGAALLTASASRIDLEAHRPDASGRIELELWRPALSRIVFGEKLTGRVLFASERDRGDFALVHEGGNFRNRWDLPLTAAGKPFAFEGLLENFAILARPTGLFVALVAHVQEENHAEGLALENVYLTVRPPDRLALLGAYDGSASVPDGTAILSFGVILAQPMLPDPYAANWRLPDNNQAQDAALLVTLAWTAASTPAIVTRLESQIPFPEPGVGRQDDDGALRERFDHHLGSNREVLSLLDLSSNDHHFGVSLESMFDQEPTLTGNRLNVQLRNIRLLMQPQVLWEPVQAGPVEMTSTMNGGRTLLGANTVKLVPVLPGVVAEEWTSAIQHRNRAGAIFSLPFGLRAFARFDAGEFLDFLIPPMLAGLLEIDFGPDMKSARQVRLVATDKLPHDKRTNPARRMTGSLSQTKNVRSDAGPPSSVLDIPVVKDHITELLDFLPLHQADLSGYGLSTFSDWRRDEPIGVTQVRFDVMNGRTSLEVIQIRTMLAPCEAHLVQTIIMERRNSGKVLRFDTGLIATDDGLFEKPAKFDKGVVIAFRKIRRIRVLTKPPLTINDGLTLSVWQEVLYDCDAELENVTANGVDGRVPLRDQSGYVQVLPTGAGAAPTEARIAALLAAVNGPIGGPSDCAIRVGKTLEMQVSGIFADAAPKDGGLAPGFVVAAYGSPKLPRAGQWSSVSINNATGEAAPVDPRHGIPVVRPTGQPYIFRDPSEAYVGHPVTEYGLLMSTSSSRILFPKPSVNPDEPDGAHILRSAAPAVADPLSLAQSTGAFPRAIYALRCTQAPKFEISDANDWRLTNPGFDLTPPAPGLAKGAEWAIQRAFPKPPKLTSLIDSANAATPWKIGVDENDIKIVIPPFGEIFTIKTNYSAVAGALPKLQKPTLEFGDALKALKEIVDSLKHFVGLGLDFDVDVDAGNGPSPSFIINITLRFRLGEGPNERIDIGVGKFYGEFEIHGQLEAALSGSTHGGLLLEFQGDIQQGILPPLLYAGGLFRFALEIRETGKPLIELGLGVTTSIGGDLIKNLLEVEVTVKYGYLLQPETLRPGVLLGLEARAKLMGGLIGFSFAVQAMARIERIDLDDKGKVTIFADIRIVATVQVAWLLEEDVDFRTQFEQKIPLSLALVPFGGGAIAIIAPISPI